MTAVAAARLAVDWTRCDGHGLCASVLPGRIEVDEWGYPVLHEAAIAATPERDLRRAAAICPALALRLIR